jgi:hypothetical protein
LKDGLAWKGDIVVMRAGVKQHSVVNMRGKDAKLSAFVVKQ